MAPSFGGPEAIYPLWWCLSLGACLGGNGTLIGASANLTVAGIAERNGVPFRFLTYTKHAFPHDAALGRHLPTCTSGSAISTEASRARRACDNARVLR